jgi:hypothetical protein
MAVGNDMASFANEKSAALALDLSVLIVDQDNDSGRLNSLDDLRQAQRLGFLLLP